MKETTYRIPASVIEDTRAFRAEVERFLNGSTSAEEFKAIRVPMGIYEQRQDGTYMVRVRGAAGVFFPHQAELVAKLSEEYGNGIVHVTTRQDLQIHGVRIHDTPSVLERLLEVGLSSRGGGGNTVRNISACSLAGACKEEVFDVTTHALALTEYLVSDRANFSLPRKFKVAFSGCGRDCGLCSVADLGFFAHQKDGAPGFSVYAGGGMGKHSALAVLIEGFVPAHAIFEVAEAVRRLFDAHGDRTNRARARLRFVVERLGAEEFRRLYREELGRVRQEAIAIPSVSPPESSDARPTEEVARSIADPAFDAWKLANVLEQRQVGVFTVLVPLTLGDVHSSTLRALAELARTVGDGTLRTTQDQDMQLRNIPHLALHDVFSALRGIGEELVASPRVRCVACAGASTCRLGICLSRGLANAIEEELRHVEMALGEPIRISGCSNSCGQHPIAPIGLHGGLARVNGRSVPHYTIVAGGHLSEGESVLALPVGRVPAKAVPSLLHDFMTAASQEQETGETLASLIDRWGADYLRKLALEYGQMPSYEESPDYYADFGASSD